MQSYRSVLILIIAAFFSCKPSGQESTSAVDNGQPTAAAQQGSAQSNAGSAYAGLGSIQIEAMRDLWDNCNSLDIVFYDTNFSLSQTEIEAIRTTLQYLLPSPVQHDPACKPIGRITFWVQGELRREADIYVGETCNYYIWIEDSKPVYINPLTPDGIQFFTNILTKGGELVPKK